MSRKSLKRKRELEEAAGATERSATDDSGDGGDGGCSEGAGGADRWADFVANPDRILRAPMATARRHIDDLMKSAIVSNLLAQDVVRMVLKVAFDRLGDLYESEQRLVLIASEVLGHMADCEHDVRCARVAQVVVNVSVSDGCVDLFYWQKLGGFFSAASDLASDQLALSGSDSCSGSCSGRVGTTAVPTDVGEVFAKLAFDTMLVKPVSDNFGLRPTWRSVLHYLSKEFHSPRRASYIDAVLDLWDSDCKSEIWSRFKSTEQEYRHRWSRMMRRFSLQPKTPMRLLETCIEENWNECWSFPSPVVPCECGYCTCKMSYDTTLIKWHVYRSCAASYISTALESALIREIVALVHAFLTLDRPPRIEWLPPVPDPSNGLDGQTPNRADDALSNFQRKGQAAYNLASFLSALKFCPSADTPTPAAFSSLLGGKAPND